jgi:hypothetical protein
MQACWARSKAAAADQLDLVKLLTLLCLARTLLLLLLLMRASWQPGGRA